MPRAGGRVPGPSAKYAPRGATATKSPVRPGAMYRHAGGSDAGVWTVTPGIARSAAAADSQAASSGQ